MEKTPLVSVLLPVYDAAETLTACLASIARQSEARWQCVIVDDGSRDASRAIAHDFAQADGRFVVLPEAHQGLVPALMRGLEACRAPLVARMDADDVMHRRRIERQLGALDADRTLALVGCHVRVFPRPLTDGFAAYENWLNAMTSPDEVAREALVECPLAHPTWMARREVLVEGGYRDAGWPEDWDLLLRLLAGGHRIGVVPRRLLHWRNAPSRLSRTDARYSLDAFTACRAYHVARGFLRDVDRYVLWGYGDTGKSLRKALSAQGKEPEGIVELHPGRIGQRIFGARVVGPDALGELFGRRMLVSVAGSVARREIRETLSAAGWVEGADFVCCA